MIFCIFTDIKASAAIAIQPNLLREDLRQIFHNLTDGPHPQLMAKGLEINNPQRLCSG